MYVCVCVLLIKYIYIYRSHQLGLPVWLFAEDHCSHSSHQTQTNPLITSALYFLSNFSNNILSMHAAGDIIIEILLINNKLIKDVI